MRFSSIIRPPCSISVWASENDKAINECNDTHAFPVFTTFHDLFSDFEEISKVSSDKLTMNSILVDIRETPSFYELLSDMPGVKKEDVKLNVKNGVLTISSERRAIRTQGDEKMYKRERFVGIRHRSIQLPEDADENNITANCTNCILSIIIPKLVSRSKKVPRSIEVN